MPLKIIAACFILVCAISCYKNTYGKLKIENEKLRTIIQTQEQQLSELETFSNELYEKVQILIEEQNTIKDEVVGLTETDELGIGGGQNDTKPLDDALILDTRIDAVATQMQQISDEVDIASKSITEIQKEIDEQKAIPTFYPTCQTAVGSGYGYRTDPISSERTFHNAIDFVCPKGTDIWASASGTVKTASYSGSYGYLVVIDHGNGYSTMYAHCSEIFVAEGDEVEQGSLIASVGSSGYATGNHLHFSILYDGSFINPLDILQKEE